MKITDETHSVTVVFSPVSVIFTPVVHPGPLRFPPSAYGPRPGPGLRRVMSERSEHREQ